MTDTSTLPDPGTLPGLFIVAYEIGTGQPGAQRLILHVAVNVGAETVSGEGQLQQAVNPPLDLNVQLRGDFTYMTVMPDETHILVVLGSDSPNLNSPDIELRMVLNHDWSGGTANYKYTSDRPGGWHTVTNVPVTRISDVVPPNS